MMLFSELHPKVKNYIKKVYEETVENSDSINFIMEESGDIKIKKSTTLISSVPRPSSSIPANSLWRILSYYC